MRRLAGVSPSTALRVNYAGARSRNPERSEESLLNRLRVRVRDGNRWPTLADNVQRNGARPVHHRLLEAGASQILTPEAPPGIP